MLKLPDVTLIVLTNKDLDNHLWAIKRSVEGIEWGVWFHGGVKIIYPEGTLGFSQELMDRFWTPPHQGLVRAVPYEGEIAGIDDWNKAIIYELPKHIETSHAMLIHADGYVKNPHLWNPEWLQYDYIGAPWPLPQDDYSYRDEEGEIQRVGNSVSLRSKKLMDLVATREWKSYYGNTNEDGFICCHNRKWLESQGCKFAPLEVAVHFSKEHDIPENAGLETFAFHSL